MILRRFMFQAVIIATFVAPNASAHVPATATLRSAMSSAAQQTRAAVFLDVQGCGVSVSEASGIASRKTRLPARVDMPLRLGSVGKLYTAAVIHKLAGRGALDLDAPASRYLQAGDAVGVANREATARQLLNHTAGIPDYYSLPDMDRWNWKLPLTPQRILSAVKGVEAENAAGAVYSYSNSGYHLLALIAERATGQNFARLVQSEMTGPLRLLETRYNTVAPKGPLHGYVGKKDWWHSAEIRHDCHIERRAQDAGRAV